REPTCAARASQAKACGPPFPCATPTDAATVPNPTGPDAPHGPGGTARSADRSAPLRTPRTHQPRARRIGVFVRGHRHEDMVAPPAVHVHEIAQDALFPETRPG